MFQQCELLQYGFSCYSQRGSLGCCRDLSSVSVTITVTMSSDSIPENENLILVLLISILPSFHFHFLKLKTCSLSNSHFSLSVYVQLGCGSVSIDLLATVAAYPKPDEKIKSTSFKVEGGGNAANALTCAARLGLKPRLISKVSEEGTSPFTYIIVDSQTLEQLLVSLES
ncbi:uncharacterized protein LOC130976132 [Arachis stenosperma]|uniref:uncharacterized protein LOC130976132 n=1 Tax=Arachis stenosperma TaxID=217475 RepID=UPI0025ABE5AE|nr:uncharacterized protein LOC130976132 [Arachis stenosperma]